MCGAELLRQEAVDQGKRGMRKAEKVGRERRTCGVEWIKEEHGLDPRSSGHGDLLAR
jgi:hypothetical protein